MRNMRRARICPSYYYVQSSCRPCRASHRGVLSLQQKTAQHPKAQDSMYCLRVIPTPCCHSKRSLWLSVSLSTFLFPIRQFSMRHRHPTTTTHIPPINQANASAAYVSLLVLLQTAGYGLTNRFKPIYGVLIGLSPVYRNKSYNSPPKQHPKNGLTIGTQK